MVVNFACVSLLRNLLLATTRLCLGKSNYSIGMILEKIEQMKSLCLPCDRAKIAVRRLPEQRQDIIYHPCETSISFRVS